VTFFPAESVQDRVLLLLQSFDVNHPLVFFCVRRFVIPAHQIEAQVGGGTVSHPPDPSQEEPLAMCTAYPYHRRTVHRFLIFLSAQYPSYLHRILQLYRREEASFPSIEVPLLQSVSVLTRTRRLSIAVSV
jgi:hypothetical protein